MNSDLPLNPSTDRSPAAVSRALLLRVLLLCSAALLSLWLTKLALFAAVGTLLGFVSLPAEPT